MVRINWILGWWYQTRWIIQVEFSYLRPSPRGCSVMSVTRRQVLCIRMHGNTKYKKNQRVRPHFDASSLDQAIAQTNTSSHPKECSRNLSPQISDTYVAPSPSSFSPQGQTHAVSAQRRNRLPHTHRTGPLTMHPAISSSLACDLGMSTPLQRIVTRKRLHFLPVPCEDENHFADIAVHRRHVVPCSTRYSSMVVHPVCFLTCSRVSLEPRRAAGLHR